MAPLLSALILGGTTLAAQDPVPAPDSPAAPAAITGPIADGTQPPPVPSKLPLNLTVLSFHQQPMRVEQPAPLPGMPATTHTIKTTIEIVKRPPPAPAPPPAEPRQPLDAATLARFAALRAERRRTEFGFLFATVYDHQRTLLRWRPHSRPDQEMTAWSNLDWNDFCGMGTYTWNDRKFVLFMAIGNQSTAALAGQSPPSPRAAYRWPRLCRHSGRRHRPGSHGPCHRPARVLSNRRPAPQSRPRRPRASQPRARGRPSAHPPIRPSRRTSSSAATPANARPSASPPSKPQPEVSVHEPAPAPSCQRLHPAGRHPPAPRR